VTRVETAVAFGLVRENQDRFTTCSQLCETEWITTRPHDTSQSIGSGTAQGRSGGFDPTKMEHSSSSLCCQTHGRTSYKLLDELARSISHGVQQCKRNNSSIQFVRDYHSFTHGLRQCIRNYSSEILRCLLYRHARACEHFVFPYVLSHSGQH